MDRQRHRAPAPLLQIFVTGLSEVSSIKLASIIYLKVFFQLLDYSKLVVIGGYSRTNYYLNRVEVFDLEDATKTCDPLSSYPQGTHGAVAEVMEDQEGAGIIKSCGGVQGSLPMGKCFDYHPANDTWVENDSLLSPRYRPGHSLIGDVWLLSGASPFGVGGASNSTEMWSGHSFIQGPYIPRIVSYHCQVTVNATHVLFVKADQQPNYLLSWPGQTWTELPPTANSLTAISCGLIENPINGREAVIVANGISEIFNMNNLTWRPGPNSSYFFSAGYAQLSDTFVVAGGDGYGQTLETIYKFDNVKYGWESLPQQLQTPAHAYPGAVTVPDSFVSCL